ncbi:MAG TPA: hypothetical protein VGG06_09090 [Thermoanaerobaculia bacterium]
MPCARVPQDRCRGARRAPARHGARAAVAVAVASHAPEVLGAVVRVTAELAGNAFEVIAEIVGAVFD